LVAAPADLVGGVATRWARAVEPDRSLPLAVARRLFAPQLRENYGETVSKIRLITHCASGYHCITIEGPR
jgi:hypothetical protein